MPLKELLYVKNSFTFQKSHIQSRKTTDRPGENVHNTYHRQRAELTSLTYEGTKDQTPNRNRGNKKTRT